jgi:hypothetical protein
MSQKFLEEDEKYIVERILDIKNGDDQVQYLIKWEGFEK